jgi:hypothetical protein
MTCSDLARLLHKCKRPSEAHVSQGLHARPLRPRILGSRKLLWSAKDVYQSIDGLRGKPRVGD